MKLITKIILATVSLTSCSITSNPPANEFPMTCAPPVGHLNVVYYEAENIAFYRWGTKGIELKKVEDVKTHPLKIPSPHNVYGGSVWKWDLSRTGVSQSVLGSDWRLDAPYDRSADGNWLAAAVYSASEGLSYSSTKRLVLLAPEKAMEPIILSLPHEIEALSWSPSGNTLAIMFLEDVTEQTPKFFLDWFIGLLYSPPPYYSVRVGLYNTSGHQICEQVFGEQINEARGYLEWLTDAQSAS